MERKSSYEILIFIGGMVVGAAAGVIGAKTYYKKKYEDDREELEEYYRQIDQYARQDHEEDDGINSPEEDESKLTGRMSPEERKEVKEKLNRNWKGTTNYASMYRLKDGSTEQKLAENEHPLDQGEDGEEEDRRCATCIFYKPEEGYCKALEEHVNEDDSCSDHQSILYSDTPEEEVFDEHQKNKNRPPKIISAETYANLPAYIDKEVLYFFAEDEMLTDDNEEPVEDPGLLVGDALTKYGFVDNDEMIIFVMNYSTDTCYEIQKLDSSWTDSH